ncbi:MAG: DUF4920 domain-containing protein [Polyangiaceae bacterium]|nr:DUF4920 domain-containing protein [Polyangiaceae bacterium]MCW5791356.1 DUF4920 domain-containing protein [Polyangiaceae bacterium]
MPRTTLRAVRSLQPQRSLQSQRSPQPQRSRWLRSRRGRLGLLPAVAALALFTGCQGGAADTQAPAPSSSAPAPNALPAGYTLYGEPLAADVAPIKLATLLENPEGYEGKTVHVEADVRRACSRKGCWMELVEGTTEKPATCRVSFKDYGFFVPTDSQGAHAKLQGVVELKKLTPRFVQHLEEEGATFANKQPDGSATELALVATGVALKK